MNRLRPAARTIGELGMAWPTYNWRVLRLVLAVVVIGLGVLKWVVAPREGSWHVDLDVYLMGARTLLAGGDLYGAVSAAGLRFTYSPFGAAVFTPVAALPTVVSYVGLTVVSIACVAVSLHVVGHRLGASRRSIILLTLIALTMEPFFRNVALGQINAALMAMVVVDLLVLRSRQGFLVGLAAGVKLVPGVFVLYFLLRRDWRSARNSALGFAASVLIGALMDPSASRFYWSGGFLGMDKFGKVGLYAIDNQSAAALLNRILHETSIPLATTVLGCLLGLGAGVVVARRALARGEDVIAVLALALGGLLASPVSWTHHWLWSAPVLLLLVHQRRWIAVCVFGAIYWTGPMWILPNGQLRELTYGPWQQVVGGAYVLCALLVLGLLHRGMRPMAPPGEPFEERSPARPEERPERVTALEVATS